MKLKVYSYACEPHYKLSWKSSKPCNLHRQCNAPLGALKTFPQITDFPEKLEGQFRRRGEKRSEIFNYTLMLGSIYSGRISSTRVLHVLIPFRRHNSTSRHAIPRFNKCMLFMFYWYRYYMSYINLERLYWGATNSATHLFRASEHNQWASNCSSHLPVRASGYFKLILAFYVTKI